MKIDKAKVSKVAQLADLHLSEEEKERFSLQLSAILDYIDQLETVDTTDVDPTFNVTGLINVLQGEEVSPSLSQEEALMNGVDTKDGYFVTKGVFEDE